jgi:phosphatidylglycerophosphate synthase
MYWAVFLGAFLLQFHCTLDFTDGHLARLKDKVSKTGALWDGIVNKTVELCCYAGISYGVFLKYNSGFFVVIGMLAMFGYFMIDYFNFLKAKYLQEGMACYSSRPLKPHLKAIKKAYWFMEQWDVRLLIIGIFAVLNKLEFALAYFALDFNFRWLFNVTREMLFRK